LAREPLVPYNVFGANFSPTNPNCNNGFIFIVPFTELQAPINKSVYVNVYISGEDMQYNRYDNVLLPLARQIFTESGDEHEGVDNSISYTCMELNPSSSSPATSADVCFGEQPVSLRSLLKRYTNYVTGSQANTNVAHQIAYYIRPIIPTISPVYATSGVSDTHPTLLRTMFYAYLGVKGGMRRRLRNYVVGEAMAPQQCVQVQMNSEETTLSSTFAPTYTTGAFAMVGKGSATFIYNTNGGVEVEMPYYSPNLFHFAFNSTGYGTTDANEMFASWCKNYTVFFETVSTSTNPIVFTEEYATAEDFNLMRYNGSPYYTLPH